MELPTPPPHPPSTEADDNGVALPDRRGLVEAAGGVGVSFAGSVEGVQCTSNFSFVDLVSELSGRIGINAEEGDLVSLGSTEVRPPELCRLGKVLEDRNETGLARFGVVGGWTDTGSTNPGGWGSKIGQYKTKKKLKSTMIADNT
mgnify:CR=1 FL=1